MPRTKSDTKANSGQTNRPIGDAADLPSRPKAETRLPNGKYKARVSRKMALVIQIMADTGLPLSAAAQQAGITRDSAIRAFKAPHVKSAYNQAVKDRRDNAAQSAYVRMVVLSESAKSEQVKAEANKWVAGVDGIAALRRVEGRYQHSHSFGGFTYDDDEPLDITPPDAASGADDD